MRKIIFTEHAPEPIGPYSQAVFCGDTLYCSGQIAIDAKSGEFIGGDVTVQTEKVCENISAILSAANCDFDNVVKTTCFIANMDEFSQFNKVYEKYFISKPARSCVAAKDIPKGALVEIEVVAVL